jgi:type II secretory pathway pseudopilin PulG
LAYDIGLALREAQTYGISVFRSNTGVFAQSYGIYFLSSTPSSFILFADTGAPNGVYDDGETVEMQTLPNGYTILSLCTTPGLGVESCSNTRLDIAFSRPDPDALIRVQALPTLHNSARIVIRSPQNDTRSVVIDASGQIHIETIVAVGLFSVVMLVATTALLALMAANRKAQSVQTVMTNLNVAVDGMARAIRMGTHYRCGSSTPTDPNCPEGNTTFYFESFGGNRSSVLDDWSYVCDNSTDRIYRSKENGANLIAITSPEIVIDSCSFYVVGAVAGDLQQPRVVVVVKGTTNANDPRSRTAFSIQATAVQRSIDI